MPLFIVSVCLLSYCLVNGIDIESEHILTVCDTLKIVHTRKSEPIPNCPPLPQTPLGGFFSQLKTGHHFDSGCSELDANNITVSSDETVAKIVANGVSALKWLIDAIKTELENLVTILLATAENKSGLGSIRRSWNHRLLIFLSLCCGLVLQMRSGRMRDCWISAFIGTLTSAVLYSAQLYFTTWYGVLILTGTTLMFYRPQIGFMTLLQLILPHSHLIIRLAFELQLFFGPVHIFFLNGGAMLVQLLCLLGLYIDEKLLIVKVLVLPLYRTLIDLFMGSNRRYSGLVQSLKRVATELFSSLQQPLTGNGGQMDEQMKLQMRGMCENATRSWFTTCSNLFNSSCTVYINGTDLVKVDQGLNVAGQWLSGLFSIVPGTNTNKATAVQRTAAKQLCQQLSDMVCRPVDLATYCTDQSIISRAYDIFKSALDQLQSFFSLNQSWIQLIADKLPISFVWEDFVSVFQLFRHSISIIFASLAIFLLLRALWRAIFFLRRYKTDLHFCNDDRQQWTSLLCDNIRFGRCKLLIRLCIFVAIERLIEGFYSTFQQVRFIVAERGSSRFAFQVQGDGPIATILRFLFGGFDISSNYCKLADASICVPEPYQPVSWISWTILFLLAILHPFALFYGSADEILCCICDRFIMPRIGRKRAQIKQSKRVERVRKTRIFIRRQTEERIHQVNLVSNRLLIAFYSRKRWYHHRYVPEIVQSIIAYFHSGRLLTNPSLACQICYQSRFEWMYKCGTLLFCDNCRSHLKKYRCPCKSTLCSDGKKVPL